MKYSFLALFVVVVLAGCTNKNQVVQEGVQPGVRQDTADNLSEDSGLEEFILKTGKKVSISEIDTSNWQTFTEKEYGFSFLYPKNWIVVEVSGNDGPLYCISNPERVPEMLSREQEISASEVFGGVRLNDKVSDIPCDITITKQSDTWPEVTKKELVSEITGSSRSIYNQDLTFALVNEKPVILGGRDEFSGYYSAPIFTSKESVLWLEIPLTNDGDLYGLSKVGDNILQSVVIL